MRVYVAGPLSSPAPIQRERNVQIAMDAAIELIRKGHDPYLPHLTHFLDLRQQETGAGIEYEDWIRLDLEWLRLCHGLLWLASSPGADRELAYAQKRGMVIFMSVDEVPIMSRGRIIISGRIVTVRCVGCGSEFTRLATVERSRVKQGCSGPFCGKRCSTRFAGFHPKKPPEAWVHGLLGTYTNHRCRCALCKDANTAYRRARRGTSAGLVAVGSGAREVLS